MRFKLTARSALVIAVLYPIIAVLAGLLARILFGGGAAEGDLNINTLIDTGMYGTIITAIALVFVSLYVFRDSARDIYFERKPFSLSKLYYIYPLALVGVTLFALLAGSSHYVGKEIARRRRQLSLFGAALRWR